MNTFHECPNCDGEIAIDYDVSPKRVACPACKSSFRVDYDADFEDGRWKDRTSLLLEPPTQTTAKQIS